jgi:predicted nucleic acid-binding protein
MRQYNTKSYKNIQEYQRKYYLRNRDALLLLRAEHYINIKQKRDKNENNVVI